MLKMFDFTCTACEYRFEKLVKDATRTVECPECSELAKRMISAPKPLLKGKGFYHTDYKKRDPSYQTKVSRKT